MLSVADLSISELYYGEKLSHQVLALRYFTCQPTVNAIAIHFAGHAVLHNCKFTNYLHIIKYIRLR